MDFNGLVVKVEMVLKEIGEGIKFIIMLLIRFVCVSRGQLYWNRVLNFCSNGKDGLFIS